MPKFQDIVGERFGRLVVKDKHSKRNQFNRIQWVCECDCGSTLLVDTGSLKSSNTKSCGCLRRDDAIRKGKANRTHGMTGSPEHKIWRGMKDRCTNEKNTFYANYGGRGITVCAEWMNDFAACYRDVGERPSPRHSIDRIDTSGNYEPGNVKWSTHDEQANNKRNNTHYHFNGELLSLSQISKLTNIPQPTLWSRLNRMKLSIDEAVKWNSYRHTSRAKEYTSPPT